MSGVAPRLDELPDQDWTCGSPALQSNAGAFVSLYNAEELRGCIGRLESRDHPLWRVVLEMAVAAATRDDRFSPLCADDLAALRVEISLLSELVAVPAWVRTPEAAFLSAGDFGAQVRRGARRGVLLPQVAVRAGWDAPRFLDETARKAGLVAGDWLKEGTEVLVFRVRSFEKCFCY
jgi:hypothetical protein